MDKELTSYGKAFFLPICAFILASATLLAAVATMDSQASPNNSNFDPYTYMPPSSRLINPYLYGNVMTSERMDVIDGVVFGLTYVCADFNNVCASAWTYPQERYPVIYIRLPISSGQAEHLCNHEYTHILNPDASEQEVVRIADTTEYSICKRLGEQYATD